MVSTRHHPRPFPEPDLAASRTPQTPTTISPSPTPASSSSPVKRSASTKRKSTGSTTATATSSPTTTSNSSRALTRRSTRSSKSSYTHTPPPFLLLWLFISLPLVIWDTGYVLGRPHTMPGGGKFHDYLYKPYALYGTVDHTYGFPGWRTKQGFVGAQGALNAIETIMYIYYLVVMGRRVATGDGFIKGVASRLNLVKREGARGDKVVVRGDGVALAVLVCFSASVMTLSKTMIYWANEYFTGFEGIGHNDWAALFWLWIVPNGAWLVGSTYMTAVLGQEIIDGMSDKSKSS